MNLKTFFSHVAERSERVLASVLPPTGQVPDELHQAMRYAVLDGGKRLRPCLVYATGLCLGVQEDRLDGAAAAVELLHAYSLIHDDLPAMDNDDLRRGKPSCHKVFGEAIAILAGDTLQCMAFEQLATSPASPDICLAMIRELAGAAGSSGLAGGQAIDLYATKRKISIELLEQMHRWKTGALIRASVMLGARLSAALDDQTEQALFRYGGDLGLSFQIMDDILDVEGDTVTLGKPQGSDVQRQKATYPALQGMQEARRRARELLDSALGELRSISRPTGLLRDLASFVITRTY